jgi:opacity protein-like surface antigen
MKSLVIIIWTIFSISSFTQPDCPSSAFSNFQLGFLGGINFSSLAGASLLIEGTTNLTSQTNLILSAGYSTINKKEGYSVNTFNNIQYIDIYQQEINFYTVGSYTVEEINYNVAPVSLGLQYIFSNGLYSPYALVEVGYNFYSFKTTKSNVVSFGQYDTYEELPEKYKNEAPDIPNDDSYTIALGLGTTYRLSSSFFLDIRYVFQYNANLVNTNQILLGIHI